MPGTTNCRYCGYNISVAIALHNTGLPDVCDNCAIEQMAKRREQKIVETLATKVMGWTLSRNELYWHIDGEIQATSGWNPLQNIADAWMIVEKFDDYKIGKDWCRLYRGDDQWFVWGPNTSREAICQAALKSVA